jgi:hypothetical protein
METDSVLRSFSFSPSLCAQVLVSTHGKHHSEKLLPSLEAGLFDDSWRIRQSSVQLLGDLLYTIGGTKAVGVAADADDEDEPTGRGGTSKAEIAINQVRGHKREKGRWMRGG